MFDYFTIIFIVVLVLGALIGFVRGGFKTLSGIVLVAAGIVVGIFLSKWLAQLYRNSFIGSSLDNAFFGFIAGKINIEVSPGYTITGADKITAADLATYNSLGQAYYANPDWDLFHVAYENVKLPPAFYGAVDKLLHNAIAAYGSGEFAFAAPISDILVSAVCFASAFLTLFAGTMLVGGIILAIIRALLKLTKNKPGMLSRILGLVGGFVIAATLVWVTCLSFNLIMLMDNDAATYLRGVLHMTEGDTTWTFAKWLTTANLGYNQVIAFFIG